MAGTGGVPAQDRARRGRQELRHPRRPAGRRAAGSEQRAKEILARLEQEHLGRRPPENGPPLRSCRSGDLQLTLFAPPEHPLLDRIRALELNSTTPLEALRLLQEWQAALAENRPIKSQ